jgi:hypothetical protein
MADLKCRKCGQRVSEDLMVGHDLRNHAEGQTKAVKRLPRHASLGINLIILGMLSLLSIFILYVVSFQIDEATKRSIRLDTLFPALFALSAVLGVVGIVLALLPPYRPSK